METFSGITIDPPGAEDLDDAIAVRRDGSGWLAQVAFPYAGEILPPGVPEDVVARQRGATAYGARHVEPMLSRETLSRLSLTPESPKPVLLVDIPVAASAAVGVPHVRRATFSSAGRLSYAAARQILTSPREELHPALAEASRLAEFLEGTRVRSGALGLRSLGTLHATDEEGRVVAVPAGAYAAMRIVHELMVLANAGLAALCAAAEIPLLYRNHVVGTPAQRSEISGTLDAVVGNAGPMAPIAARIDHLVGRARLGPAPAGHWALNLSAYAWFTSPIRRFADLVNQRMLVALLDGTSLPYGLGELELIAAHLNGIDDASKESTQSFLKGYAGTKANATISRGDLGRASATEFTAVIKAAVEGDLPDHVVEEARKRLSMLTSKDLARLLFAGGKGTDLVLSYLAAVPHVAVSIVNYCIQDPNVPWTDFNVEDRETGSPSKPRFGAIAQASIDGTPHASPEIEASTKKAATQAACLALLANAIGRQVPAAPKTSTSSTPRASSARIEPLRDPATARGHLQEICQKRGWPLPTFEVTMSGPPHSPTFVAIATVERNGALVDGKAAEGKSRKEAEKLASANLIARLVEESRAV